MEMRRFVVSAGVAVAVVAAVSGVGGAVASDGSGGKQLVVTAVQKSSAEVPNGGHLVGSRFVGDDDLMVDGRTVGRGIRSCEVVAPGAGPGNGTFQCLMTLSLGEGTLTLQATPVLSEVGLEDVTAAVTGGTGRFRHARGQALVEELSPIELRYSLDLR